MSEELLSVLDNRYKQHGGAPVMQGLGDSIIGGSAAYSMFNSPAYQAQLAALPTYAAAVAAGLSVGTLCQNAGYVFRVSGMTGASGGVAPTGKGATTDGGVTWTFVASLLVQKMGNSMLMWAEVFSGQRVRWDMASGYGGIANTVLKVIVVNGGTGYTAPVITFTGAAGVSVGATAIPTVVNGVITAVTVTNPGYSSSFNMALTDPTGTGAVLSLVQAGSGTFGVPGCTIQDVKARLADVLANAPNIMVVHIGTNNSVLPQSEAQLAAALATDIADLKYIYETLMGAGIKVCAVCLTPRAFNVTRLSKIYLQRMNKWIRSYVASKSFANPSAYDNIALADASGYWTDGTNGSFWPIGGLGGVIGAVSVDGLHSAPRGGMYNGYTIAKAIERWIGPPQTYNSRSYSADDGYDPVLNPGGNMLEGPDWVTNWVVTRGRQCNANGNVWRCTTPGTTANSGVGPTGASGAQNVSDGTAKWDYMGPAKASVFGAGSTAISTATNVPAGITVSGAMANGYALSRANGSATACAGTVVCALESPWSSGQVGQRQAITFSLGSGPANERWDLLYSYGVYSSYAFRNILLADLGVTQFEAEVEIELSNVLNMTRCDLTLFDSATGGALVTVGPSLSQAGQEMINSAGDPLVIPNSGKLLYKIPPFILPPDFTNFAFGLSVGFNASGGAASAGATIKFNHFALDRYASA